MNSEWERLMAELDADWREFLPAMRDGQARLESFIGRKERLEREVARLTAEQSNIDQGSHAHVIAEVLERNRPVPGESPESLSAKLKALEAFRERMNAEETARKDLLEASVALQQQISAELAPVPLLRRIGDAQSRFAVLRLGLERRTRRFRLAWGAVSRALDAVSLLVAFGLEELTTLAIEAWLGKDLSTAARFMTFVVIYLAEKEGVDRFAQTLRRKQSGVIAEQVNAARRQQRKELTSLTNEVHYALAALPETPQ